MRKFLLITLLLQIIISSHAQIRKYPPLIKEDIDIAELNDKYAKDAISENYIFYKIATTKPITFKSEIEDKYILKDYNLKKLFPNESVKAVALSKVLFDTITMRAPKSDEAQNFIYFEANMDKNTVPQLLCGAVSRNLILVNRNVYVTDTYVNLLGMSIKLISNLLDINKKPIRLGDKCIVTTRDDHNTGSINLIIAVELKDSFQKIVNSGNIIFSVDITSTAESKITKKDVGNSVQIFHRPFNVLAFENGVVHLMCDKRNTLLSKAQLIGSIGDDKFRIRATFIPLLSAVYSKYRNDAKMDYKEFIGGSKKNNKIDIKELDTNVFIYNIGYDVDTLHFIDTKSPFFAHFRYNVSVSKNENSDYLFRTIGRMKNAEEAHNDVSKYVLKIKDYITSRVKYPREAQDKEISGKFVFTFQVTPEGKITNVKVIESPHKSFTDEVLRVTRMAPPFKRVDYGKEDYNLPFSISIIFKM